MPHRPVLLKEVIEFLKPKPGDFIIDGTVDGGGHAVEILKRVGASGKLLGVDWDRKMIEKLKQRAPKNLFLVHGNYAELSAILRKKKLGKADGLLLDLGFSSEQIENSGRGFSFLKDEPLFMTYSDDREPVKRILKKLSEADLEKIIRELGGEKFAGRIARAVKGRRSIETTSELAETVRSAVPRNYERGRIHPATRTFQALRIYANDELGNLEKTLENLPKILKSGGRAVVINFHSLEDRVAKNIFRELAKEEKIKILTSKPVTATEEEIKENPRSRSAKLRAVMII